jgi:pimeloyl-ACP methyl ester carboxylesterase
VTDTNLRFYGAAPFRVAAIHGGPGAAGEMAPVARRLSQAQGVLEPLQTARSVEGQIQELCDVLLQHARIPAVLIGYSWGAWLSLFAAARYPELAGKLILVSSAPFDESYAAHLQTHRLARLTDAEKTDYLSAIAALGKPAAPDPVTPAVLPPVASATLEKLGRLAAKADAYAPIVEIDEPDVTVSGEIYQAVWKEASAMRRSGELLRQARTVKCPVVAIHGDSDSSPAAGVAEPLSAALGEFRLVVLPRCGHTPWRERYAQEEFYRILLHEIG